MRPITLNDGTFIINKYDMVEYLKNLGFDINDIIEYLCGDLLCHEECLMYKADEYEMIVDDLRSNMIAAYNELESIADDLAIGKGGTKAKMAEKIKYVLNCYMDC